MTTITGLTAERLLALEAATVVDGNIAGDNLILVTHDGTSIDAGSVRGPEGPVGPAGGDITGAFRVTRGSDVAVTRGNPINFTTEDLDESSAFSGSTFTAPVHGIYHVEWSLVFQTAIAVGAWVQSRLRHNSGVFMKGLRIFGDGNIQHVSLGSATLELAAGDTLSIDIDSDAAVSYTISGEEATMFSGHLVGHLA